MHNIRSETSIRGWVHGEELHRFQTWNPTHRPLWPSHVHAPSNQQQTTPRTLQYAPTLQEADPAEKDKFYSDLRILLQGTLPDDKVLFFGDLNAR